MMSTSKEGGKSNLENFQQQKLPWLQSSEGKGDNDGGDRPAQLLSWLCNIPVDLLVEL